jgi:outer membrane autotransporter protein
MDLHRTEEKDGSRERAGIYGVIGSGQTDVAHFNGSDAGKDDFSAYSLGAYWTHMGVQDWYLDGVFQATWYEAEGRSNRLPTLKSEGLGLAASLEGGYPLQLGERWVVEPQIQGIYQSINMSTASDAAADVRFDDVTSLTGRIGARVAKSWIENAPEPRLTTGWLRASLWHEFLGDPQIAFSSAAGDVPFRADLSGSWAELNAGISKQVNQDSTFYASLGYQVGADDHRHAYSGMMGVQVTW